MFTIKINKQSIELVAFNPHIQSATTIDFVVFTHDVTDEDVAGVLADNCIPKSLTQIIYTNN
jgi:hypothetical protein